MNAFPPDINPVATLLCRLFLKAKALLRQRIKKLLPSRPDIIIVIGRHGSYSIHVKKAYETRGISTTLLFTLALQKAEEEAAILTPKNIYIYCDDYLMPSLAYKKDIYTYALPLSQTNSTATPIPDFGFINWPGAGIQSYDATCDQLVSLGRSEPEFSGMMIWAGNSKTNSKRKELVRYSSLCSWLRIFDTSRGDPFLPMIEQIKYSYLIDIEGRGYSGRVKLMLFFRRPLFLQERDQVEWYHKLLVPYIHYIPVRNDLSNLEEQYYWAEQNQDESHAIAQRAQDFALANLRTSNAVEYLKGILLD